MKHIGFLIVVYILLFQAEMASAQTLDQCRATHNFQEYSACIVNATKDNPDFQFPEAKELNLYALVLAEKVRAGELSDLEALYEFKKRLNELRRDLRR